MYLSVSKFIYSLYIYIYIYYIIFFIFFDCAKSVQLTGNKILIAIIVHLNRSLLWPSVLNKFSVVTLCHTYKTNYDCCIAYVWDGSISLIQWAGYSRTQSCLMLCTNCKIYGIKNKGSWNLFSTFILLCHYSTQYRSFCDELGHVFRYISGKQKKRKR